MKKIFCLLLLLLLLITGCGQGSGGKDAAAGGRYKGTGEHGTVTPFKQAPQKVLTLALSSDGIVMGLGMEDKLVAVNYLADDPVSSNLVEQAKKIQHKIKSLRRRGKPPCVNLLKEFLARVKLKVELKVKLAPTTLQQNVCF